MHWYFARSISSSETSLSSLDFYKLISNYFNSYFAIIL